MKLAMTPGFDFGSYLERAKLSSPGPQASSPLNRIKLDLRVTTTPELQMQTAMAKLSGDADLRVRGTAARPAVLGRIDILEGEVFFNGAKYRLERGDVIFTNPARIEPILDLEASTRVSDYDVSIGVNGTADKLNVNYRSEPPLPSADIIALLALGRTREESTSLPEFVSLGFLGCRFEPHLERGFELNDLQPRPKIVRRESNQDRSTRTSQCDQCGSRTAGDD